MEGSIMHLTYDATTDVAYLSLRPVREGERLGPTLLLEPDQEFPGAVALDFSRDDGRVVGLEFQIASACVPLDLLATAVRTDGTSLSARFAERVAPNLGASRAGPGSKRAKGRRDVLH